MVTVFNANVKLTTNITPAVRRLRQLRKEAGKTVESLKKINTSLGRINNKKRIEKATGKMNKFDRSIKNTIRSFIVFGNLKTAIQSLIIPLASVNSLLVAMGGIIAIAIGVKAVKAAVDFDAAMAEVRAVTNATTQEFVLLENAAKKMGITTQFTAIQAAEGLKALARAGLGVKGSIEALPATLNLAAVGNIKLQESAEIATKILGVMGLKTSDLSRVIDVLTVTANNSNTNVAELGRAMVEVGKGAKDTGNSVEDVAAILGVFANNGIRGTRAGNRFKQILNKIIKGSKGAETSIDGLSTSLRRGNVVMNSLGIKTRDVTTKAFVPMIEILKQFNKSSLSASDGLDIFGARTNLAAATIISATDDIEVMRGKLDNIIGSADRFRKIKFETFGGGLTLITSAVTGLGIELGQAITQSKVWQDALIGVAQAFANLAKGVKENKSALTGLTEIIANQIRGITIIAQAEINGLIGLLELVQRKKAKAQTRSEVVRTLASNTFLTENLSTVLKVFSGNADRANVAFNSFLKSGNVGNLEIINRLLDEQNNVIQESGLRIQEAQKFKEVSNKRERTNLLKLIIADNERISQAEANALTLNELKSQAVQITKTTGKEEIDIVKQVAAMTAEIRKKQVAQEQELNRTNFDRQKELLNQSTIGLKEKATQEIEDKKTLAAVLLQIDTNSLAKLKEINQTEIDFKKKKAEEETSIAEKKTTSILKIEEDQNTTLNRLTLDRFAFEKTQAEKEFLVQAKLINKATKAGKKRTKLIENQAKILNKKLVKIDKKRLKTVEKFNETIFQITLKNTVREESLRVAELAGFKDIEAQKVATSIDSIENQRLASVQGTIDRLNNLVFSKDAELLTEEDHANAIITLTQDTAEEIKRINLTALSEFQDVTDQKLEIVIDSEGKIIEAKRKGGVDGVELDKQTFSDQKANATVQIAQLAADIIKTGKVSGASIGATLGTIVGGIAGSFFGPAGSSVGVAVGSIVGGAIGSVLGSFSDKKTSPALKRIKGDVAEFELQFSKINALGLNDFDTNFSSLFVFDEQAFNAVFLPEFITGIESLGVSFDGALFAVQRFQSSASAVFSTLQELGGFDNLEGLGLLEGFQNLDTEIQTGSASFQQIKLDTADFTLGVAGATLASSEFTAGMVALVVSLNRVNVATIENLSAYAQTVDAIGAVDDRMTGLRNTGSALTLANTILNNSLLFTIPQIKTVASQGKRLTEIQKRNTEIVLQLADADNLLDTEIQALLDEQAALNTESQNIEQSMVGVKDSTEGATEAIDKNKDGTEKNKTSNKKLNDVLGKLVIVLDKLSSNTRGSFGTASNRANTFRTQGIDPLNESMKTLKLNTDSYSKALRNIPRNINTTITTNGGGSGDRSGSNEVFPTGPIVDNGDGTVSQPIHLPPIQGNAHGGIVSQPTFVGMQNNRRALAGESGPEMVAPLFRDSKGNLGVTMQSGGPSVNVINQGTIIGDEASFREFGEKMGNELLTLIEDGRVPSLTR